MVCRRLFDLRSKSHVSKLQFRHWQNLCELNNRTKEARPEDFKPDQTRFYMKIAKTEVHFDSHFFFFALLQLSRFKWYWLACVAGLFHQADSPMGAGKP